MPGGDLTSFTQNILRIGGHYFGVNHAVFHNIADFQYVFAERPLFFGNQSGICGYAIDYTQGHALADFFQIRRIEKELHVRTPLALIRGPGAPPRTQAVRATTGLLNVPMPASTISTVSPGCIGPTPAGVPVAITSPGISVITRDTHGIITSTGKTIALKAECCFLTPFSRVSTVPEARSYSVSITGPRGQKVSK